MDQPDQRTYLGRQPARVLLVDLSPPLDEDVCQGIVASVEKCLSLVCSLAGPPRLSFFGLYALGTYPEALLPLQHTKGNFHRLQSGLNELMNCFHEYSANGGNMCTYIGQGVQEAASMFKRQAHSLLQTNSSGNNWSQYEITVVTCQMSNIVLKQVEKATKDIDAENLKKIQIVQVCNADRLLTLDDGPAVNSQASTMSEHSDSSINALVDCVTLDFSAVALENYFKEWLHDVSTDSEHLHIVLPGDEEQIVLKCDLHERILDPNLVPFSYQYSVHPEIIAMRLNPSASMAKGGGITIPIHRLRVVNRIPLDGVCESVLHGMPLVVKATMCWRVEWDELETNQHNFLSLCHQLNKQGEVLLCQLQKDPRPQSVRHGGGFRYHTPQSKPRGYFLVLPSNSNSLLIKSVADADLTLPADVNTTETPSAESEAVIENSLSKLPRIDMYNPLLVTSGLSESLAVQLTRSAPSGSLKRRVAPAANSGYNQLSDDRNRGRPGFRNPAPPLRGRGVTPYNQRAPPATWEMNRSNTHDQRKRPKYPDDTGNFYSRSMAPFPTNL